MSLNHIGSVLLTVTAFSLQTLAQTLSSSKAQKQMYLEKSDKLYLPFGHERI